MSVIKVGVFNHRTEVLDECLYPTWDERCRNVGDWGWYLEESNGCMRVKYVKSRNGAIRSLESYLKNDEFKNAVVIREHGFLCLSEGE